MQNHSSTKPTTHRFSTRESGARNFLALAAATRSGAGTHKSGPRGGNRNEVRDMLDEYYSEQTLEDQPD